MRTAALALLVLVGCASQRPVTEIFVVLDAEPALRAEATSVRVVVAGSRVGGTAEIALDRMITGPELVWPITLGVVPRDNDATRGVRVESTLVTSTGGVARASARTGYRPERTLVLTLLHEGCCVGTSCSATETCSACVCTSDAIDTGALPEHDGGV
jgi:hypothetical protein